MEARLMSLRAKKDIVEARIQHESARLRPDTLQLRLLKAQKLRLKDRIAQLERSAFAIAS